MNFHVTVTFEPIGGETRLTMRGTFPSAKARDHVIATYGALDGLTETIGRLGEYLVKA